MNFTKATALDLAIAEIQGEVTVKKLRTKKAPKSSGAQRNRRAVANGVSAEGIAVGKGKMGNLNKVGGIGKDMVANLDKVVTNYNKVAKANAKDAARERAAERRAVREAEAAAALDTLLEDILG